MIGRVKKQWIRFCTCLFLGLLVLFGVFSCLEDDSEKPLDHGQPYARYTVKGKVMNKNNEVVPGIQIIINGLSQTTYSETLLYSDTLSSGINGEFLFSDDYARPDIKYKIIHRDIDKDGNIRKYKTDSLKVYMPELTGASGNWFKGSASAEVTIILKERPTVEND